MHAESKQGRKTAEKGTQVALFHEDRKPQILRIEKNLHTLGVFTPRHKRPTELTKTIETVVRLPDGERIEATVRVESTEHSGLPTTPDQDKFYAFTKILDDIRQVTGTLQNPISFSYAEMLRLLGLSRNGKRSREIDEWLQRMTVTSITSTGAVWRASRKRYVSDTFHVFDRVVRIGEELDSGELADRNHVWVSSWLLENFEANYVLPIDYEIYRRMKIPIAKALVAFLQVWFYAARNAKNTTVQKRIRELSELLGVRYYPHKSKIEEKMGPGLDELKELGLIRFWEIQPTADGKEFKLVIAPGDRFLPERKAELLQAPNSPQAKEFTDLLEQLFDQGVREQRARDLLFNAKDLSMVRLRLLYVLDMINRRKHGRNRINNEAGFIIYFLENEGRVPSEFAAQATAAEENQKMHLRTAYSDFCWKETRKHFIALPEAERRCRMERARAFLKRDDVHAYLPEKVFECMAEDEALKSLEPEIELPTLDQFCLTAQANRNLFTV